MAKSQDYQVDRLRKVVGFGGRHEKDFKSGAKAHSLFAEAVDLLTEIENHRSSSGKAGLAAASEVRQQAFAQLWDDLDAIAQTAQQISRHNPLISDTFVSPDKRKTGEFINVAREFLFHAEPFKAEFISYEMPADFLNELYAKLTRCVAISEGPIVPQASTGDVLREKLGRAQELVDVLDVIIQNKYRDDERVLTEWKVATRPIGQR